MVRKQMGDESGVKIGGRARNQTARLMRRLIAILLCQILAGLVIAQQEDEAGLQVRRLFQMLELTESQLRSGIEALLKQYL